MRVRKYGKGKSWLGNGKIQLAMILSVVVAQLALIPTGLFIMTQHWRLPRAFPMSDFFVPLIIYALNTTLLMKSDDCVFHEGCWCWCQGYLLCDMSNWFSVGMAEI